MSATDTLAGGIIAIGSAIATVLIGDWLQNRRGAREDEKKLKVLAFEASRLFGEYVDYLGRNKSKLEPILAENIERRDFDKPTFQAVLDNALPVFPLRMPEEIPYPKEPHGQTIVKSTRYLNDVVIEANELAQELKSGIRDSTTVSKFLVATSLALNLEVIEDINEMMLTEYAASLEDIRGGKMPKKAKERWLAKGKKNIQDIYNAGANMDEVTERSRKIVESFLKRINW